MRTAKGAENKRNYYALFLAIVNRDTVADAISKMGISNYSREETSKLNEKQRKFKKYKAEMIEKRKNGATYGELAEEYDFYSRASICERLKGVK